MSKKELLYKKLGALRLEVDSSIVDEIVASANAAFQEQLLQQTPCYAWQDFSVQEPGVGQKVLLRSPKNGNVWDDEYSAELKESYTLLKLKWVPMPADVSRSAYVIEYNSIGEDFSVRIEATDLNKALIKFATNYHSIDAVHSITKVE